MKLTLQKLADRLEEEINIRLIKIGILELEIIKMEKKFASPDAIRPKQLEMANLVFELNPVAHIIFQQHPHIEEAFDEYLKIYEREIGSKKKKRSANFEDAMEINSFDQIH
jgi:hypothetical protein